MKYLKNFSFIACFAVALVLIIFSFSEIFAMQQTDADNCVISCESNRQGCYNMNPDRRLCEEEYKNCAVTCKPQSNDSSDQQPQDEKISPPEKY